MPRPEGAGIKPPGRPSTRGRVQAKVSSPSFNTETPGPSRRGPRGQRRCGSSPWARRQVAPLTSCESTSGFSEHGEGAGLPRGTEACPLWDPECQVPAPGGEVAQQETHSGACGTEAAPAQELTLADTPLCPVPRGPATAAPVRWPQRHSRKGGFVHVRSRLCRRKGRRQTSGEAALATPPPARPSPAKDAGEPRAALQSGWPPGSPPRPACSHAAATPLLAVWGSHTARKVLEPFST